jgi:hypothetical protein
LIPSKDVLGRQLQLVLTKGVQPAQSYGGIGYDRLSCSEELQIVAALQNRAIARGYVQAAKYEK